MAQNNASRVQVTLTSPDAIKAWGQVPRGLKAKALEQAILLLQKNKTFAPMFFNEVVESEAVKNNTQANKIEEEQNVSQQEKNTTAEKKSSKREKRIVSEW